MDRKKSKKKPNIVCLFHTPINKKKSALKFLRSHNYSIKKKAKNKWIQLLPFGLFVSNCNAIIFHVLFYICLNFFFTLFMFSCAFFLFSSPTFCTLSFYVSLSLSLLLIYNSVTAFNHYFCLFFKGYSVVVTFYTFKKLFFLSPLPQ